MAKSITRCPTKRTLQRPRFREDAAQIVEAAEVPIAKGKKVLIMFRWRVNAQQELPVMSNTDRIVRLKTVLARTGLSRSTLYRKIAEGTFPAQIKISVHGAGWHESSLNAWIEDPVGFGRKSCGLSEHKH